MAQQFTKLELLAAFISSAAHDVDHPVSIVEFIIFLF